MITIKYPSNLLSKYVKYYWHLKTTDENLSQRIIPTGEIQLLFHNQKPFKEQLQNNKTIIQPQNLICGQVTNYKDVFCSNETDMTGVVLYPYSANVFFKIPSYELTDYSVDICDINKNFKFVKNQTTDLNSFEERIKIIEDYLLKEIFIKNIEHFSISSDTVKLIEINKGLLSIKELANNFYMSERQFERIFKTFVGISPKQYCEIIKINNAITILKNSESLTETAYKSGYYDQSQFINSLKKYTGFTPKILKAIC